jgi:hypothetical protein
VLETSTPLVDVADSLGLELNVGIDGPGNLDWTPSTSGDEADDLDVLTDQSRMVDPLDPDLDKRYQILRDLGAWEANLGGFEAPVWRKVHEELSCAYWLDPEYVPGEGEPPNPILSHDPAEREAAFARIRKAVLGKKMRAPVRGALAPRDPNWTKPADGEDDLKEAERTALQIANGVRGREVDYLDWKSDDTYEILISFGRSCRLDDEVIRDGVADYEPGDRDRLVQFLKELQYVSLATGFTQSWELVKADDLVTPEMACKTLGIEMADVGKLDPPDPHEVTLDIEVSVPAGVKREWIVSRLNELAMKVADDLAEYNDDLEITHEVK